MNEEVTKEDLHALLEEKGIKYSKRLGVDRLKALLNDEESPSNESEDSEDEGTPKTKSPEEGLPVPVAAEDTTDPILDDTVPLKEKEQKDEKEPKESFTAQLGVVEFKSPAHGSKAAIMKKQLDAQPKITIMIPLGLGEPRGATHPVQLNGYRLNIRKGVYVDVPLQIAKVVMESQQLTEEALNNYYLMNAEGVSQAMRDKNINQG